jgi:hypothetical protein
VQALRSGVVQSEMASRVIGLFWPLACIALVTAGALRLAGALLEPERRSVSTAAAGAPTREPNRPELFR